MLGARSEYNRDRLEIDTLHQNPLVQLQSWLQTAIDENIPEPAAMCLSTASPEGQPSGRMVLLRGIDDRGIAFFTNYRSRKAQELDANPACAATLWWPDFQRQIRIEGRAEKVEPELSDAYFASRPIDSQLASAASPQSQVVASREELEGAIEALRETGELIRPGHWGGYRIIPHAIEFWQGGYARLHDRFRYTREVDDWRIERLAP